MEQLPTLSKPSMETKQGNLDLGILETAWKMHRNRVGISTIYSDDEQSISAKAW